MTVALLQKKQISSIECNDKLDWLRKYLLFTGGIATDDTISKITVGFYDYKF